MHPNLFFILSLIMLTSICDTINQLFLKSAINSIEVPALSFKKIFRFIIKLIIIPRIWLGFCFTVISLCIWLFVLSKADLNFAFSADSMHYIFIAFTAKFILKEKLGSKRWLGTFFIIIGIVMVSFN